MVTKDRQPPAIEKPEVSEEDARHPLLSPPWRINLWVSAMRCVGAGGLCDGEIAVSVQIVTISHVE